MKKMTHEEYCQKLIDLDSEFIPLEEYDGQRKSIKHLHLICGTEFKTRPERALKGVGCKKCNNKKISHQEYVERLLEASRDHLVLENYQGMHVAILHKHVVCGYEWKVKPNNMLRRDHVCPKCSKSIKKDTVTYKKELEAINPDFEVLEEYVNIDTPIMHMHKKCGYSWKTTPYRMLSGIGCLKCVGPYTLSEDEYTKLLAEASPEHQLISGYVNSTTKALHVHKKCGHEWLVKPSYVLSGRTYCPKCNKSKGEIAIHGVLSEIKGIRFVEQYIFSDCKRELELPFDFAVFQDNKLIMLIEYNGEHHYEPIKKFGGLENLKRVQHNDFLKQRYCLLNSTPLLIMPYWLYVNNSKLDKDMIKKDITEYLKSQLKLQSLEEQP